MHTPPSPSQTVDLARESLRMHKDTAEKSFRFMAIAMMAITAFATGIHALHGVWRDVRGRRDDRRSYRPRETMEHNHSASYAAPSRHDEPDLERKWSHREESRGRGREEGEEWGDYSRRQGRGRER